VRPPIPDRASGPVLGIGIDVVAIDRFAASLLRTPGLRQRLFSPEELITPSGDPRSAASLAGRFAAKEAVAKALGVPPGMDWHDCTVATLASGRPELQIRRTVAAAAEALGVARWHVSLSHDAGIAAAIVLALGVPRPGSA
jgi:holo-[acyl-carrier protein] synthase